MVVPSQAEFYRPVLEIVLESVRQISRQDLIEATVSRLDATQADRLEVFGGSGTVKKFEYRVTTGAADQLSEAGLLQRPRRGYFQITEPGRKFLVSHDGPIVRRQLVELARALQANSTESLASELYEGSEEAVEEIPPQELMRHAHRRIESDLASELSTILISMTPEQFEKVAVALLEKMGYGIGEAVGRSGDGGIDGVITQDALGLDKVYIQAKRYTAGSVGEPEIRNFSGSLDAQGATKGVFITTSTFSSTAQQTAQNISAGNKFIRLVDGNELARLMIRYGVGVVTEYTYEIKKLDENYFAEDV